MNQDPNIQRAQIHMTQRRWPDAERELGQALLASPQSAIVHAMMSLVQCEQLKLNDALESARQAITNDPEYPEAHFAMGVVLWKKNRFAEALMPAEQAIELDPFDPRYHALVAAIRIEQKSWQKALESANRGLEINPQDQWCLNLRGYAQVQLGDRAAANQTIQGALENDPENAFTHASQGWAFLHQSKPKPAMEHFSEALRLNPNMDWAKAGMIEAMKAKNIFYRLLLKYFLFMARQNQRMQMFVVIGGYLGYRFLRSLAQNNPAISSWVTPIIIAYAIFALSTWLAPVLMNMMLRFNRYAKYALSREQTWATNLVAIVIVSAIALMITSIWADDAFFTAGLLMFLLALPSAAIFSCEWGWPRWVALAAMGFLFCVASLEFSLELLDGHADRIYPPFNIFIYGMLILQLSMNYLISVQVKK